MRVTSRTQAGPGLPGSIPATALEPGGPVGQDGCPGVALGEPGRAAAACLGWVGGTAGAHLQPLGDKPVMGTDKGRSVLGVLLTVSVAEPCQGMESRWLWCSRQPGKDLGHHTHRGTALPVVQVLGERLWGTCPFFPFSHAPSRLMESIPGIVVPYTGLNPWVPPCLLWKGGPTAPSDPTLEVTSALCHPLDHPLPAWSHPLHLLPSRRTACAEPCPVPSGSPLLPAEAWGPAAASCWHEGHPLGTGHGSQLAPLTAGGRTHSSAGLPALGWAAGGSPASRR